MISNRIANSGKFLQMPAETQLLYFHFVLRADDDGVVESYPTMKLLGLAPDNLKVLLARGFVKQLNEDEVIVIMNWIEHNKIRPDRKVNSIYLPLLKEKYPEIQILEPKPRADTKKITGGQTMDVHSPLKLSKVKLSKDNKGVVRGNEDVEKIVRWAYERAGVSPSISRDLFLQSVNRAIDRVGYNAVYEVFAEEDNAITFLQTIKSL